MNEAKLRKDGAYVVYWMNAYRRLHHNFALERAIEWAVELDQPLVILDALRVGYPWASDRLHRFVLDGIVDHQIALQTSTVFHYGYVEQKDGEGRGLLEALGESASIVVTDDFPCFFLPRMVKAAAEKLSVRLESVDSNGLLPMRATERVFERAVDFRRHLQKTLLPHLEQMPLADPLEAVQLPRLSEKDLPKGLLAKWPLAKSIEKLNLASLPIDHSVVPASYRGGEKAAREAMHAFFDNRIEKYLMRNHPDEDGASGLSPYLHFGHISVHEIWSELAANEGWSKDRVAERVTAAKGYWGMSEAAESFFDELVTWRELGFNFTSHRDDYDRYTSLPKWARDTLAKHESDERPFLYTLEQFENAQTHDELWNAAQTQLARDGRIQNYLRMLWGKKILEWSKTAEDALKILIELNNKYAVDGRNPNSYSGIFWVLGRYDRPWPERAIYGTIRSMSSVNTRKKVELDRYLATYGSKSQQRLDL
ncbi:MAG: deoxyribodipyrimidine photolyase [Sandaracinaceae bacterium]|nr:deoxyribodipyrimidine photolyase [Sandaracinaceae bacterium]